MAKMRRRVSPISDFAMPAPDCRRPATLIGFRADIFYGRTHMKNRISLVILGSAMLAAPPALAHFKLLGPASRIVEDDRGDPQKAAPCGGTHADFGKPSYAVTDVKGGSNLHVEVQETIYHPGHFRIALAVNSPTELPVDPKATTMPNDRGVQMSVSAEVMNPVAPPVLVDGLWQHSAKSDNPVY